MIVRSDVQMGGISYRWEKRVRQGCVLWLFVCGVLLFVKHLPPVQIGKEAARQESLRGELRLCAVFVCPGRVIAPISRAPPPEPRHYLIVFV